MKKNSAGNLRPLTDSASSPSKRPLTAIAHHSWQPFLAPGDWALDATAGTGRDTLALAKAVQPGGHVFALDIQDTALRQTSQLLASQNLLHSVSLIRGNHADLHSILPCAIRARLALVVFNLGYLPHGDHDLTTSLETTLPALHEALLLLRPGGALSVMAYRGHPAGAREYEAVKAFFQNLPAPHQCLHHHPSGSPRSPGPVLFVSHYPR